MNVATPHGLWESTFLKRKSHSDLPRNDPTSIFSKQAHPEWTHTTISSNMFSPISLILFSNTLKFHMFLPMLITAIQDVGWIITYPAYQS